MEDFFEESRQFIALCLPLLKKNRRMDKHGNNKDEMQAEYEQAPRL